MNIAKIDGKVYEYTNAVEFFKTIEKLSNKLKETFVLSIETGYPVNLSGQRIDFIQYLKACQENNEIAYIYTSKESLQTIF